MGPWGRCQWWSQGSSCDSAAAGGRHQTSSIVLCATDLCLKLIQSGDAFGILRTEQHSHPVLAKAALLMAERDTESCSDPYEGVCTNKATIKSWGELSNSRWLACSL